MIKLIKLAKVPIDLILKILRYICEVYLKWYDGDQVTGKHEVQIDQHTYEIK